MNARTLNIVAWVLQGLLALAFAIAAVPKLIGAKPAVEMFEAIGWGQWFRYVTGLVEVAGPALLLVPGFAAAGAALMAVTMIGAIASHAFIGGTAIPASVLFLLCCALLWLRRDQIPALRTRFGL